MKSILKNKFLFSLAIYNLISFLYFFILFCIEYSKILGFPSFALVSSILIQIVIALFSFLIVNLFIIFFYKRDCIKDKSFSTLVVAALISFIVVLSLYFFLLIPISINNIIHDYDAYGVINVSNLINYILQFINCIVLITYTAIMLKKEFSYRKISPEITNNQNNII